MYDITWESSASRRFSWIIMPYLFFVFWKSGKIFNCRLLQYIGGALRVKRSHSSLHLEEPGQEPVCLCNKRKSNGLTRSHTGTTASFLCIAMILKWFELISKSEQTGRSISLDTVTCERRSHCFAYCSILFRCLAFQKLIFGKWCRIRCYASAMIAYFAT